MYLMLQFAHAFVISGMHNERNMTFECTTFIMYSTSTTRKPHLKQKYLEWCKGNNVFTASRTYGLNCYPFSTAGCYMTFPLGHESGPVSESDCPRHLVKEKKLGKQNKKNDNSL